MGELEDLVRFTIKRDLTKTTLKISQQHLINKINQGFNKDVKYLMNFNTLEKPHQVIVRNK